jgi:acylphosphatase
MSRVRFLVRGRVQGVGFRWFVVRLAERLDLAGLVRNLPDGSVEVIAEGTGGALVELEEGLSRGPRMAQVTSVDKSDVPHDMKLPKPFSDY